MLRLIVVSSSGNGAITWVRAEMELRHIPVFTLLWRPFIYCNYLLTNSRFASDMCLKESLLFYG